MAIDVAENVVPAMFSQDLFARIAGDRLGGLVPEHDPSVEIGDVDADGDNAVQKAAEVCRKDGFGLISSHLIFSQHDFFEKGITGIPASGYPFSPGMSSVLVVF